MELVGNLGTACITESNQTHKPCMQETTNENEMITQFHTASDIFLKLGGFWSIHS